MDSLSDNVVLHAAASGLVLARLSKLQAYLVVARAMRFVGQELVHLRPVPLPGLQVQQWLKFWQSWSEPVSQTDDVLLLLMFSGRAPDVGPH